MKTEIEAPPGLSENPSEWPEVAIIVLNWNNYEDTAKCLEKLENITYNNYRVIVVDNGSTDNSGERLQNDFNWCEFVFNERNLGFSQGCNTGLKKIQDESIEYVLFLNNDVVVDNSTILNLVNTAEKSEKISIVGGVISDFNSDHIIFAGGEICYLTASASVSNSIPEDEFETGFITGAMILLPKQYLVDIGGLSEDYFFGSEDLELCHETLERGGKLLINANARARHQHSSTAGHKSAFKYYHFTINRFVFSSRNSSRIYRYLFYIFFVLSRGVRFIQWIVDGRHDLIWATIMAVYDYLKIGKPKRRTDLL
jgi:GT2 family glycosyltransferase